MINKNLANISDLKFNTTVWSVNPFNGGSISECLIISDGISSKYINNQEFLFINVKIKNDNYTESIIYIDANNLTRIYKSEKYSRKYLKTILDDPDFIEYEILNKRSYKLEELRVNTLGTDFKAIEYYNKAIAKFPSQFI
jgi:hypothetical protein